MNYNFTTLPLLLQYKEFLYQLMQSMLEEAHFNSLIKVTTFCQFILLQPAIMYSKCQGYDVYDRTDILESVAAGCFGQYTSQSVIFAVQPKHIPQESI